MKKLLLKFSTLAVLFLAAMTVGQAQDVPITLNNGWNWISYPRSEPMSINDALSGFTPAVGDMIVSQTDGSAQYLNGRWRGNLTTLIPGKGYMYKSLDGTVQSFVFGGVGNDPSALPEEALSGEFKVAANGTKVRFSPGNLQCRIDPTQEVQAIVGTLSSTMDVVPYDTYYRYSLCQIIYKAEELTAAGLGPGPITSIAFESYSTNHYLRNGVTIWMSSTTLTEAPATSVSTSGMTQTYTGSLVQQEGWTPIYFSTPFTWNGQSNLMVTVVVNHGSWDSKTNWNCTPTSYFSYGRANSDSNGGYDPSSTTYSVIQGSYRPNIRFNGKGVVTWRFAEKQWDVIGAGNANISSSYTGWFDLFGWGTSGHPHGANRYQPWSTSMLNSDYYAYGNNSYNLFDQTGEADWGCNPISNGGNQPNQWRTLTGEEWDYMINTRSGKRYAKAQVSGVNGLIVLPDNWQTSYYSLSNTNTADAAFTSNTITATQWQTLEDHGAVFLPTGGSRSGTSFGYETFCYYWSSSSNGSGLAQCIMVNNSSITLPSNDPPFFGSSVRLVCQSNQRIRTLGVVNVTSTSATVNAEVDYSGTVSARGICWNTTGHPIYDDNHAASGSGRGGFSKTLTGLQPNTTYHVRAYAKISNVYRYGNELTFTTHEQLAVSTAEVTGITATFALCGGTVSDCGENVTARGVCWNTVGSPTVNNNHTIDGKGTGSFNSILTNLTIGNTYYVRAYATTAEGTVYGNQRSFTPTAPTGAIGGLFSVSATQQVFFSRGNLQYQAFTNTWRFTTNQYDYIGYNNYNISSSYNGWIDLFGWGTSGYNHGAVCYQPWSTSTTDSDYYAYGSSTYNLYNQSGRADWGYNAISNGGNQTNQWRTLTKDEWEYVFNTRSTASGIRYAKATVAEVYGVILLPDNWSSSYYSLNYTNTPTVDYTINTITASGWNTLEQHGAVFLPMTGYRINGNEVEGTNNYSPSEGRYCEYWSSSYYDSSRAYKVLIYGIGIGTPALNTQSYSNRSNGLAVRLVRNAQ